MRGQNHNYVLITIIRCLPASYLTMVSKTKRDSLTILVDILNALNIPRALRKMAIVYKSNLNFERIDKYLSLLLSTGLIEAASSPDGSETYRITRKGQVFISRYAELMVLLKLTEAENSVSDSRSRMSAAICELCGKAPAEGGFWTLCQDCTQLYNTFLQFAEEHDADPKDLEPLKEILRSQAR